MATPLTDGINALTAYANEVTGVSDTNLSDAVYSLAQGYVSRHDYIAGVEWIEGKFIDATGNSGNNGYLHYTTEPIYLSQGTYLLCGEQTVNTSLNYRIHKYDSDDNWVEQIINRAYGRGLVAMPINISDSHEYIRLSIASTFTGILIKFFDV